MLGNMDIYKRCEKEFNYFSNLEVGFLRRALDDSGHCSSLSINGALCNTELKLTEIYFTHEFGFFRHEKYERVSFVLCIQCVLRPSRFLFFCKCVSSNIGLYKKLLLYL